jgi:hypothetical protein
VKSGEGWSQLTMVFGGGFSSPWSDTCLCGFNEGGQHFPSSLGFKDDVRQQGLRSWVKEVFVHGMVLIAVEEHVCGCL